MPWVNGMTIVGEDGKIKCSTVANVVGVDLSDRPQVRAALETRDFAVSNYALGRLTRRPIFAAAYPTQAIDPSVQAVVTTSIDLHWVNALIASLERRSGSTVLLIDSVGTVIAGDPGMSNWIGQRIDNTPFFKRLGPGDEGTARGEGLDGVRRIFGFVRVPSSDARLVIGLNEAEVLQRTDREILLAYLQLFFFGLLVLLLAWFGGERLIVEPIRTLARTAERIGRGDLRRACHARPGPRSSRRSPPPSTTWRRNLPIASWNCARPIRTSRSWRRAMRCRGSPTGAALTRVLPPIGSGPASSAGRSHCS
jgi:hypothetical protein